MDQRGRSAQELAHQRVRPIRVLDAVLVLRATDTVFDFEVLDGLHIQGDAVHGRRAALEPPDRGPRPEVVTITPGMTMAEIEKAAITAALAASKGNRRKAAEALGIGERTMYRKLRDYGIPTR